MADRLILRLPQEVAFQPLTGDALVEWSLFRDQKMRVKPQKTALNQVYQKLPQTMQVGNKANVSVLVPAGCFLFSSVQAPAGQVKYLQKAIPYLLEEQLADPIEELHFVVFGKPSGLRASVGAIRKSFIEGWLEALGEHQLNAVHLVPDVLCLPWSDNHWQLLISDHKVLVRTEEYSGWGCAVGQLPLFLEASLEERKTAIKDRVSREMGREVIEGSRDDSAVSHPLVINLANEQHNKIASRVLDALKLELMEKTKGQETAVNLPSVKVVRQVLEMSVLEILGMGFVKSELEKKSANVLQGSFKSQRVRQSSKIKYQRFAWVAAIWFVGFLSLSWVQGFYLNQQADALRDASETVFRQLFPNEKRIVNLRSQLKSQLKKNAGSQSVDFMRLLQPIGQQIATLTAKDKQAVQINRVTFRQKSGQVQLELEFKSYPYVDELKNLIEQAGLVASIDGANQGSENKIKARLKVSAT